MPFPTSTTCYWMRLAMATSVRELQLPAASAPSPCLGPGAGQRPRRAFLEKYFRSNPFLIYL
ncbi:hypothetical protein HNQ93_001341 [Hymenobacter luteus]|uniref:Uncharacterized protein n=2 Tax=Hymenobacter TaxID=89966 RepID=A0A7W9SZ18_9BACT|nr:MULTISPECIES: hypothetical protein [Hymenobacter]MBB4601298.1 hypothetical protein [Hymenobacter latericoloratus]MBB6058495.1 hypothetical protein [Hymenobacter luteus]